MPALPNVSKCLKVEWTFEDDVLNVALSRAYFHYSGVPPTVTEAQTLADAIVADFAANVLENLFTGHTFTGVKVTDLNSSTGAEVSSVATANGTLTGAVLPFDTCAITAYEVARRYRGGHARGYWPFGVAASLTEPNQWEPAFVTQFSGDITGHFAAILGFGWTLAGVLKQVAVSYYSGFHVVTNPVTGRARNVPLVRGTPLQDDVVTITGRGRLGTQRRRLGR